MTRHWSTRLLGAALALAFGLAMAGPEVHQCPLHDQAAAPAASHAGHAATQHDADHQTSGHQNGHCTCPQACCPVGVGVALPAVSFRWTIVAASSDDSAPVLAVSFRPSTPPHFLPFALAPPRALA